MFFELTNSSTTFQIYIIRTCIFIKRFHIDYINDILIFLQSTKKHVEHIKLILKRLKKFNLFVKLSKCNFYVFHVNFFDFKISLDDILMQKSKIVIVKKWSLSKSHKNVQFFIKFANFYRRFMYDFSRASFELTSLFKENEKSKFKIKFVFILKEIESMKTFKRVFTSASMLRHYEFNDELIIKMSVSNFVIAKMFSQLEKIDD
jgi:hypothetical protein